MQNQSNQTPVKEFYLGKIIEQHASIVKNIISKWASMKDRLYYFIDTNSGTGRNDEWNCSGSPIVFLDAIKKIGLSYRAFFIDEDEGSLYLLEKRIGDNSNCHYIHGDNTVVLSGVLNSIPYGSFGMIYHDPNERPDYNLLECANNHYNAQRLDLLIRCNSTGIKRARSKNNGIPDLADYTKLKKPNGWMIQEPQSKFQWTFLFGSNWENINPWGNHGFHDLNSPKGQAIFNKANYTKAKLKEIEEERHPKLFDRDIYKEDILPKKRQKSKKKSEYLTYAEYLRHPRFRAIRKQAMENVNYICQKCKKAKATQVHHLKYPPWGEFDVVENLMPVCYRCHCEIHGKEK